MAGCCLPAVPLVPQPEGLRVRVTYGEGLAVEQRLLSAGDGTGPAAGEPGAST